ncbi:hypothetical protein [Kitasatospora sp. NPDC091207]|uniref:hypothetical protein n=1 Tax=Kitasatospora sp. NPDC091207 TaxID=3364083 RepID=UPI0038064EAE
MFDLHIPLDDLRVDSREPLFVDGRVWLTVDGREFPAARWSDAALSVLGSLGRAVAGALDGETADFYFFEGSYFVRLTPLPPEPRAPRRVRVTAVDDGDTWAADAEGNAVPVAEGEVRAEVVVPLREVAERHGAALALVGGWAEARRENEVIRVLSRMYRYDAADPRFDH